MSQSQSLFHVKHCEASLALALTVLAAGTGLLWPAASQPDQPIEPLPVRTLSFREASPPLSPSTRALPPWLSSDEDPPPPAWRLRGDGLWVPWTLDPPAWLTTIAAGYVMAETVPLPPERPAQLREIEGTPRREVLPKRRAHEADLCERHGLKKTYADRYRWRCR